MNDILGDIPSEEIEDFYRTVSANVKRLRTAKKLSQLEVALRLGIRSIAFYSNCENLRYSKHFNLEHLYRLSKALEVDMCELLKPLAVSDMV